MNTVKVKNIYLLTQNKLMPIQKADDRIAAAAYVHLVCRQQPVLIRFQAKQMNNLLAGEKLTLIQLMVTFKLN